ncbi:MAG: hypothetical protein AAF694_25785 [Bacteroidota bacterium]
MLDSPSLGFAENFEIRTLVELLEKGDMVQATHRHDFFFMLALENGLGFTRFFKKKVGMSPIVLRKEAE